VKLPLLFSFVYFFVLSFIHLLFIFTQEIDKSTIKYVGPHERPINSLVNLEEKKRTKNKCVTLLITSPSTRQLQSLLPKSIFIC
jgi:hypothetical protein